MESNQNNPKENVVLVIGACTLDRIITVETYPKEDTKNRSTAVFETGGGNAANTATALSHLSTSLFATSSLSQSHSPIRSITVKLLTKLGDDSIRNQLCQELTSSGVDLSSDLFLKGDKHSTSHVTTIIVSEKEHTRTCIFHPGTCGEITPEDIDRVILRNNDMEKLFENVVHLHSDSRHTKAAVILAKEARRRNIPVSVDVERDRGKDMDALLELATMVFTNQDQMSDYMDRKRREGAFTSISPPNLHSPQLAPHIAAATNLAFHFFSQYSAPFKDVIMTRGENGSICIKHESTSLLDDKQTYTDKDISYCFEYNKEKDTVIICDPIYDNPKEYVEIQQHRFQICQVGVLKDLNIVDTTGAGDSFIGGYILFSIWTKFGLFEQDQDSSHLSSMDGIRLGLKFSSWVAGTKIGGMGSRSALPNGQKMDEELGVNLKEIQASLNLLIHPSIDV